MGKKSRNNKKTNTPKTDDFKPKGLLVTTAQDYHNNYVAQLAYDIEFNKHLSVLMPAMLGLYPLPLRLYDALDFRCREYIIVDDPEDVGVFNEMLISQHQEEKTIYPIKYEAFLEKKPKGGCYVLFDLPQDKRLELTKSLKDEKDSVVISIGKLKTEESKAKSSLVNQTSDVLSELYQITMQDGKPHCMIFPVNSILDIRDIGFADEEEKPKLVSTLYKICSAYEKDYGVKDLQTSATGSEEKIIQYRKALEERDFEISILKAVAASAGADMTGLEKGIKEVQALKQAFSAEYDKTQDAFIQEKLESDFQNNVSELLVKITSNMLTVVNRDKYEKMIVESLGEDVWKNKLSERSRTYLISAMMTYDSMNKLEDKSSLDYSGVCLQITKVLDEEMTARFYTQYKSFLFKNYLFDKWPEAMKSRYGYDPISANDFTLGTISPLFGIDVRGNIVDQASFGMVKSFAREVLYKPELKEIDIQRGLFSIVACTEKTRKDYRNPAAHRESMPYISAKECIDYLVEQTKMLKVILQNMRGVRV